MVYAESLKLLAVKISELEMTVDGISAGCLGVSNPRLGVSLLSEGCWEVMEEL